MDGSVSLVSNGSQPTSRQAGDQIKMNGSLEHVTSAATANDVAIKDSNQPSGSTENLEHQNITDIGFDCEQLFALSLKFFKNYEGKAFHASYDDRNKLVALGWQVKYGPSSPEKGPQIGALDIVGRDRRQAWHDLGQMSRNEAIKIYVETINGLCHLYRPFIDAHWREMVERERLEHEEAEKCRLEEERLREEEEKQRKTREEIEKFDEQKRIIQDALNKQTYVQFVAYAQKAYPKSPQDQERLIKHLQEKHYEQYMQQVIQQQQLSNNPVMAASDPSLQQSSSHGNDQQTKPSSPSDQLLPSNHFELSSKCNPVDQQFGQLNSNSHFTNGGVRDPECEDSLGEEDAGISKGVAAVPKIWTKDDVAQFKEAIKKEGGSDGVVKVGHGEIVTIRVPTHPEGSSLFWEFCTDHYDIGFGLLFEWTEDPGSNISVHVQDSDSEDDDDVSESSPSETASSPGLRSVGEGGDVEKGTSKIKFDASESSSKKYKSEFNLPTTVIMPIYRRDAHEHVYAGSHVYPGKGVYLLKFDNSYSLWRSKILYYRVYYTR